MEKFNFIKKVIINNPWAVKIMFDLDKKENRLDEAFKKAKTILKKI